MSRGGDASISNAGHAKLPGDASHVVDGCGLRPTHSTDLLSGADGTTAHTHSDTIDASLDEMVGLTRGDDITANQLDLGIVLLDVLNHVNLVDGITLQCENESIPDTSRIHNIPEKNRSQ